MKYQTLKHVLLSCMLAILLAKGATGQELTGSVIDQTTLLPIQGVALFISGTTIGCTTNAEGKFSLKLPFTPCILIADHVSYDAFIKPMDSADQLQISLKPSVFEIEEVQVRADNHRKRNLRYFYAHFNQDDRGQVKVLNDSVLYFVRDKMHFVARCYDPLIIENETLGYRITAIIKSFQVTVHDGPNGPQLPLNSANGGEVINMDGYFYYEPLEKIHPEKKDIYEVNRWKAFYGSYRHFLQALYYDNFSEQGFLVEPKPDSVWFTDVTNEQISEGDKQFKLNAEVLKVTYHFDDHDEPVPLAYLRNRNFYYERKTSIYPTSEPFTVRKNGTSPRPTFIILGSMMIKNFANSLPDDYQPE